MVAPDPVSGRPVVSVIIPARNEETALGACLTSLVAQTGVRLEIIVVDDGSTDNTPSIIKKFLPQLRYIRKNNGGQASAL